MTMEGTQDGDTKVKIHNLLDMNSKNIENVLDGTEPGHAVNKAQLDSAIANIPQAGGAPTTTVFREHPYLGWSDGWKAIKFNFGSSVSTGRFVFDADFTIWNSNILLNGATYKSHVCYLGLRLVNQDNVVLRGPVYYQFPFAYIYGTLKPAMSFGLSDKVYYSNANFHTKYQYTYNQTDPIGDIQFQYFWWESTMKNDNTYQIIKPQDGFAVVSMTCDRYEI